MDKSRNSFLLRIIVYFEIVNWYDVRVCSVQLYVNPKQNDISSLNSSSKDVFYSVYQSICIKLYTNISIFMCPVAFRRRIAGASSPSDSNEGGGKIFILHLFISDDLIINIEFEKVDKSFITYTDYWSILNEKASVLSIFRVKRL